MTIPHDPDCNHGILPGAYHAPESFVHPSALIDHALALQHRQEVLIYHCLRLAEELSALKACIEEERLP